jgi:hypothetical protein
MCGLGRVSTRKDRAPAARLPPSAPGAVAGALTQAAAATLGVGKRWRARRNPKRLAAKVACDFRSSDTPSAVMPLRQTPAVTVRYGQRLPHGRWVLSSRNAHAASRCRTVWLRSSAARDSPCPFPVAGARQNCRRLPHWGHGNRRRAHRHARSLRRGGPVRWPTERHCGKRAAGTVPVRMTGGCHQA